jgi:hypothetical protein
MSSYQFPCGCQVVEDKTGDVATTRCDEHKKRWPHRLDAKEKQ